MKQAQNAQKRRGRPSSRNNGKSHNSNRSEPKVRGNPKQLAEKYKNQAREALQSGDRTQAEYYFQFADHYQRVLNEMRGPNTQNNSQNNNQNNADQPDDGNDGTQPQRRRGNRRNQRNRGGQDQTEQQDNAAQDASDGQSEPQAGQSKDEMASDNSDADAAKDKPAPKRRRTSAKKENVSGADIAAQEQPREVHPELDLNAEVPAKPVRRRGPARRKASDADANSNSGESDTVVAVKPSTGDEAA